MGAPLIFQIHMDQINEELNEIDGDAIANPIRTFFENAAVAFAAGESRTGIDALQKIGKAAKYAPPTNENGANNPWITHAKVYSKPVENELEAPDVTYLTRTSHGIRWREAFDKDGILRSAEILGEGSE